METWKVEKITSCDSTNTLVKDLRAAGKITDKTAFMTDFQNSGRGQDKNIWHSNSGENLLVSLYIEPDIAAERYFSITLLTSLAISAMLEEEGIEAHIKWPNDIYYGQRKIAGILIENSMSSAIIANSIIGIGLNVNQTNFPEWLPNPVSMTNITGRKYEIGNTIEKLIVQFNLLLEELYCNHDDTLFANYTERLFRREVWADYLIDNEPVKARILGVKNDGRIIIELKSGEIRSFMFGEISYII